MRHLLKTLTSRTVKLWLAIMVLLVGVRIALAFIIKDYATKLSTA